MAKTTLYLPDPLKADIEREARRRGASEADVIRDANRKGQGRPAPQGGLFHGESISDRVDELLVGFGEHDRCGHQRAPRLLQRR